MTQFPNPHSNATPDPKVVDATRADADLSGINGANPYAGNDVGAKLPNAVSTDQQLTSRIRHDDSWLRKPITTQHDEGLARQIEQRIRDQSATNVRDAVVGRRPPPQRDATGRFIPRNGGTRP